MKKALLLIAAATIMLASCGKENETPNSTTVSEQVPDSKVFPSFETLGKYIGRTDTATIIAEFQENGFVVTNDGGTLYAEKAFDAVGTGKYALGRRYDGIYGAIYNYTQTTSTNPIDLKSVFVYFVNSALDTYYENSHYSYFYGRYGLGGGTEDKDRFLNILPSLTDEDYRQGVGVEMYEGVSDGFMYVITVTIKDNFILYSISYEGPKNTK